MGFLDKISEFMDDLGIADPEKDAKNEEISKSEAANMAEWAIKGAETIIVLSDKDIMKKKIVELLEESYAKGARATINMKK